MNAIKLKRELMPCSIPNLRLNAFIWADTCSRIRINVPWQFYNFTHFLIVVGFAFLLL
jgi:hypothetical protein